MRSALKGTLVASQREPRRLTLWVLLIVFSTFPSISKAQSSESSAAGETVQPDKAKAYYHYTLGHLYQERGALFQRPELLNQAIDELRLALQYDPASSYLSIELADLYAATGRWRSALQEMEDALSRNPNDKAARRLLGRIYLRLLSSQAPMDLLPRATHRFEQIVQTDPDDIDSYMILAQLYRAGQEDAKAEETLKKALSLQPDSRDANAQLGMYYMELGDYREAARLLEKATSGEPDAQLLATLGYAYSQLRNFDSAVNAYDRAVAADSKNPAFRKAYADALFYNHQYAEAIEQFQAALEANPSDPEPHLRLSQIYRTQNNFDKARESLAKASELDPNNLEIQYNGVLLAESEGKFAEAIRNVENLLSASSQTDPSMYTPQEKANRGIFLEKLGFLYRDQENFEAAETAFGQMRLLGGESAIRAEIRIIETYQESRHYDKALAASEKAHRDHPDNRDLATTYASLLSTLGDVDKAIGVLNPLLKSERADREILLSIAQAHLRAKQFTSARETAIKAAAYSEGDGDLAYDHFLLGSIWEREKQFEKAEEEFRKSLEIDPHSAMALNYLGYMLADLGIHLDEAVQMIRKALETEPQSAAYLDSLGWAYYRLERMDLAEEYLRKAASRMPSDPTIRDHLGDVYYKIGRLQEAQREWKAALLEWSRLPKNEIDPDEVSKIEQKLKEAEVKLAQEPRR